MSLIPFTLFIIPAAIIACCMLPLALQDWFRRKEPAQLSLWLVIVYVLLCFVLVTGLVHYAAYSVDPYLTGAFILGGILILAILTFARPPIIAFADCLITGIAVVFTSYIGVFALFLLLGVIGFYGHINKTKKKFTDVYPFVTAYFICLVAVLLIVWLLTSLQL